MFCFIQHWFREYGICDLTATYLLYDSIYMSVIFFSNFTTEITTSSILRNYHFGTWNTWKREGNRAWSMYEQWRHIIGHFNGVRIYDKTSGVDIRMTPIWPLLCLTDAISISIWVVLWGRLTLDWRRSGFFNQRKIDIDPMSTHVGHHTTPAGI